MQLMNSEKSIGLEKYYHPHTGSNAHFDKLGSKGSKK